MCCKAAPRAMEGQSLFLGGYNQDTGSDRVPSQVCRNVCFAASKLTRVLPCPVACCTDTCLRLRQGLG